MRENPAYAEFEIGEWSYGTPRVLSWGGSAQLIVGKYCSFAEGVTILLGGEHRVDWVSTYPFTAIFEGARHIQGHPRSRGNVVIGHDVWVGYGATIISGVEIGHGAVIGARSVVTKNVPPYAIVAGNPAALRRYRFDEADVRCLLDIAWWDWPLAGVQDAWPLLLTDDIRTFCERFGKTSAHSAWQAAQR